MLLNTLQCKVSPPCQQRSTGAYTVTRLRSPGLAPKVIGPGPDFCVNRISLAVLEATLRVAEQKQRLC